VADVWIVNASPLIVLGKAGCLSLLEDLADVLIIPAAVAIEVRSGPMHDPAADWLRTSGASHVAPLLSIPSNIGTFQLGRGESAVLATAVSQPGSETILDDLAARRAAVSLGVSVRGTLAVILTAKQRGLIPLAAPLMDRVQQAGLFVSPSLRAQALALVGE
jgi:predicted nucleic acid-binding protein